MRIGLDIGGTKVLAVAIDGDPTKPIAVHRAPTVPDADHLSDTIESLVRGIEAELGETAHAVGVGIAGLVDRSGTLWFAPNIPGVTAYPVRDELSRRLDRPVAVENDATTATWAEAKVGAGEGSDHVVMVSLGTGIGAAYVLDGRLYRGWNGFAGESGHMVVDRNGPRHHTGERGPWELFASGTALGVLAREAAADGRASALVARAGSVDGIDASHIEAAVLDEDAQMLAILDEFAHEVGLGVANLVHILDPEVVVVGGGLVDLGDALIDPVRRWTAAHVLGGDLRPAVRIDAARLGSRAAAIGAAMLAGGG